MTRALTPSLVCIALLVGGCAKEDKPPTAHPERPTTAPSTSPATQPAGVIGPQEAPFLSELTQLTAGFDRAGEGYFSSDMKWVIFQGTPKGEQHYQMYVAPLNWENGKAPSLGEPVRVSPPDSRNTCGFFSPDGQNIIFGSTAGKEKPDEPSAGYQRRGGNYQWAFPNGMEIYRATNWQQGADLAKPENRLTDNDAYDAEGAFSPDGKWIVFGSRRTGDMEIWMMKSDGSNAVQITSVKGYDGGPFFSPGGKRLVYRSDRQGNDLLQVFVADLAFDEQGNITGTSQERQVTNDNNVNWGPYWHPDGRHLIFATSAHGHQNYELYAIRDDGTHPVRITHTEGFDGLPVFSPDGKWLMWSSKRAPDKATQLFLARFTPPKDW